jgi:hypothetical protein
MAPSEPTGASENEYLLQLKQLQERLPDLQREFAAHDDSGDLITEWMEVSHGLPLEQKVPLYRSRGSRPARLVFEEIEKQHET